MNYGVFSLPSATSNSQCQSGFVPLLIIPLQRQLKKTCRSPTRSKFWEEPRLSEALWHPRNVSGWAQAAWPGQNRTPGWMWTAWNHQRVELELPPRRGCHLQPQQTGTGRSAQTSARALWCFQSKVWHAWQTMKSKYPPAPGKTSLNTTFKMGKQKEFRHSTQDVLLDTQTQLCSPLSICFPLGRWIAWPSSASGNLWCHCANLELLWGLPQTIKHLGWYGH